MTQRRNFTLTSLTVTLATAALLAIACLTASAARAADPLVQGFDVTATANAGGDPYTQAGGHPYEVVTDIQPATHSDPDIFGLPVTDEDQRNLEVDLPPGLVGNATGLPTCPIHEVPSEVKPGHADFCPAGSQVGIARIELVGGFPVWPAYYPIYNLPAPKGSPALFGLEVAFQAPVRLRFKVSADDHSLTTVVRNTSQAFSITRATIHIWGVPSDPVHDEFRAGCFDAETGASTGSCPANSPVKPLLSMPTSCEGPQQAHLSFDTWQHPGVEHNVDSTSTIEATGCEQPEFDPTVVARPTTSVADSPSGLDVELSVPQREGECEAGPPVDCGLESAHLRNAEITLPEGLVTNPAAANGLAACTSAQVGIDPATGVANDNPAACPDASKLGTAEVDTALIDHPLPGSVYLAKPHDNPFDSLLALYVVIDDPQSGVRVKLAGEVTLDPVTGRLTTSFEENPQTPFDHFKLNLFGGAGGALRTPATCGDYTTASVLTPWSAPASGPPADPSDAWTIASAPGGGSCPASQGAMLNSPGFDAGSVSPVAAMATPTLVNLRRQDGSQEFSSVTLSLPPGLTGKLAGLEQCSNAALAAAASKSGNEEKASPSCPASSRLGTIDAGVGAGPAPYFAQGAAYLAGPYKGAPLSLAMITPATAGPFDLGTVVVRVALHLDRNSARITAESDPLPRILQGIPLDIRSVRVSLDRPDFTRNGTSCDSFSFAGSLFSTLGQSAALAEPFQLGECAALPFKPKLGIRLIGGTKRGAHPKLRAVLQMPAGGANIARASVALPRSEFLDQAHIGTVCTRVQFAAHQCPAASVYGKVVATSPLVDYPLSGPVYLRSSDHKLPDLVMALHGPPSQPIEVDAVGRIDSVRGGIRTTFEGVPDLPVSRLVLSMAGAKKGLLQNSRDICRRTFYASVRFDGQNGKTHDLEVPLKNGKCRPGRR